MFKQNRLPTLDTQIWFAESKKLILHSFFEKDTCPNRVLQKTTSLSTSSIRACLCQDVVRRLKACCDHVTQTERSEILSVFGQKLINSGHSLGSAQFILVHGTTKFLELLRKSKLPTDYPNYRPLHCSRDFDLQQRTKKNATHTQLFF